MKIISFPHYTCGGLLCDMLNGTFSEVDANGGINSIQHSLGKIGDSADIQDDFDIDQLYQRLDKANTDQWIGTHCWLGKCDLDRFGKIINVTTATHRSRLYRWLRAYHHYYVNSQPWQGLVGQQEIDKQRETAKNYLRPFLHIHHRCVINLEFADVVESRPAFTRLLPQGYQSHLDRWHRVNAFLFESTAWTSPAAQRFHEAEHENALSQSYVYE